MLEKLVPDNLLQIYQYLSLLDVARASEASEYLSHFAKDYIYKKFTDCYIDVFYKSVWLFQLSWQGCYRPFVAIYEWSDMEIVVRHFGPHIKCLKLTQFDNICVLMKHVAFILEQCTHLDVLHFDNLTFPIDNDICSRGDGSATPSHFEQYQHEI